MADNSFTRSAQSAAKQAAAITPADAPLTRNIRALYIGGAGDVVGIPIDQDTEVTFVGLQAGTILPVMFKQISLTGTSATNLVGLYE